MRNDDMNIAIASSGLGHVARGVETWARDTAAALGEQGVQVTLFGGGDALPAALPGVEIVRVPCLQRFAPLTQRLARHSPGFTWRWGLKDAYGWEQASFWFGLRGYLRRARFDLLHVQDPQLAAWCRRSRTRGGLRTQEILAHGTEEPTSFLAPFACVQHLAPWHLEQSRLQLGPGGERRLWCAIPNFVDTDMFHPPGSESCASRREAMGLPPGAFVVGCVAVVKKDHKRIDYLIREFAAFANSAAGAARDAHLVVAGARQAESAELEALAVRLAPGRVHIRFDVPRAEVPELYRVFDVFALTSLFEMMPIALLEALASGVPVLVHRHPVLEWMAGTTADDAGGLAIDMSRKGELAHTLEGLAPSWLAQAARAARRQAETHFARRVVIRDYIAYYRRILEGR